MLETLRHIVQAASTSANVNEALEIIVDWVANAMTVDACAVYLADPSDGSLLLSAARGLNPAAVGKLRLAPQQGLVGMVAERREPLNVHGAAQHPHYHHSPMSGEERFNSFLGVPIIHYGRLLGVLVASQIRDRKFDDDEVAFLITVTAQLANAIRAADAVDSGRRLIPSRPGRPFYEGTPAAPGVAIGTLVLPSPLADLRAVPDHPCNDIPAEKEAFRNAVREVERELYDGARRMADFLPSEAHTLFDVYTLLLGDSLVEKALTYIEGGNWAPAALRKSIDKYTAVFEQMEDAYLRSRAEDIRAVGRRILIHLQSDQRAAIEYPERTVLVGDEVSLARIADVPPGKLVGIVCLKGSTLSHTAVVARALGVPAVLGVAELSLKYLENREAVVDGYRGRVFVEPTTAIRREFERLVREEDTLARELANLRSRESCTLDGAYLPLEANAGLLTDIEPAKQANAAGVGLYRTEFMFMLREAFPGEEHQFNCYREVLESFHPLPVTMRTLDVGADKPLPYFPIEEDNSFLGWRGIRITLDHPEIFLAQLRALLRANEGLHNLRILLPMVSHQQQIRAALELLKQAHRGLLEEGYEVPLPQLGAMVEVPAAVYQVREFAEQVDFFSIGTNDLTQYLLAVDRNNAHVAGLYEILHPALLRALQSGIAAAHGAGRTISVCGEMASDPVGALVLLGMGIDSLSLAAASIPRVKWMICSFSKQEAEALAERAIQLPDAPAIRSLLNEALESKGLGGLIHAGL